MPALVSYPASLCLSLFICRVGDAMRTSRHMETCPTQSVCVFPAHTGTNYNGHGTLGALTEGAFCRVEVFPKGLEAF